MELQFLSFLHVKHSKIKLMVKGGWEKDFLNSYWELLGIAKHDKKKVEGMAYEDS